MKYEHLTSNQLSSAAKVGEYSLWLVVGSIVTAWWLPAHLGEQHPIPKLQATMSFIFLWVYFLNPITRYGLNRLPHGYKNFTKGEGSYLPLKLRVLVMLVASAGYTYGLFTSA